MVHQMVVVGRLVLFGQIPAPFYLIGLLKAAIGQLEGLLNSLLMHAAAGSSHASIL